MNTRVLFCQETKILAVPTLSDLVTVVTLNFLGGGAYTLLLPRRSCPETPNTYPRMLSDISAF